MMTCASATSATDHVSTAAEAAPHGGAGDGRRLAHQLHTILVDSPDEGQATDRFLQIVCRLTHARGGLFFGVDAAGHLSVSPCARWPAVFGEGAMEPLHALARVGQAEGAVQLARADAEGKGVVFAVPVFRPGRGTECLVVMVPVEADSTGKLVVLSQVLQCLASFAGQWRGRFAELSQATDSQSWRVFSQSVQAAAATETLAAAAERLADGLAKMLPARLVALGFRRAGGLCRVLAVAPFHRFDPAGELSRCLEAVLAEAMLERHGAPDERAARSAGATDSVQQLLTCAKAAHIQRAPLHDSQGEIIGACVVLLDSPATVSDRDTFTLGLSLIGPQLDLVRRAQSGSLAPFVRLRQKVRRLTPRGRRWLAAGVLTSVLVLCALPVPYRLTCPCEVQPVTRRYVVAPYEGRLETADAEPGDWVTAGQVLARMDGADIRLEMAGLKADLQRATKQRHSAMASHETAAGQITRLEMKRLQLRIDLLQERMDNLEIRSPTDGVIISGDPKKLQGARLTMGQTLIEVGPLGETVLEVAIRDADISHAREGLPVRFRLEALPSVKFHGELRRIHPRSEQRDGQNVFVGEVAMTPSENLLRPGMRGRAKIGAARRPLFWILFHRAWEQALLRFAW